jgi:hypothetical protein
MQKVAFWNNDFVVSLKKKATSGNTADSIKNLVTRAVASV